MECHRRYDLRHAWPHETFGWRPVRSRRRFARGVLRFVMKKNGRAILAANVGPCQFKVVGSCSFQKTSSSFTITTPRRIEPQPDRLGMARTTRANLFIAGIVGRAAGVADLCLNTPGTAQDSASTPRKTSGGQSGLIGLNETLLLRSLTAIVQSVDFLGQRTRYVGVSRGWQLLLAGLLLLVGGG